MNQNLDYEWRFWVMVTILSPWIAAVTVASWIYDKRHT
jgi:hypothetical protein